MKNVIFILIIALTNANLLLGSALTSTTPPCCQDINIYGNQYDNAPTKIKHYNGHSYITGTAIVNSQSYFTFSKFDSNNKVIWEYQSTTPAHIFDFVKTNSNAFLLVGRTNPPNANNRGIIVKIDDSGSLNFSKAYDNYGREQFHKIIKHDNPVNVNFPYYMTGIHNTLTGTIYSDAAMLINLDEFGVINWSIEYPYSTDNQFTRGLLGLDDGNVLLIGDSEGKALLAKVDGANGQLIRGIRETRIMTYYDGVELSNGNIVVAGLDGTGTTNINAQLSLFDSNLNFLDNVRFVNEGILRFQEVVKDNSDNLYLSGETRNGFNVICKASTTGANLNIDLMRYFSNGETTYNSPCIDVFGNRLYYADARTDHPKSFGNSDIIFGHFNTSLAEECFKDTTISYIQPTMFFTPIQINSFSFTMPSPTSIVNIGNQSYSEEHICQQPNSNESIEPISHLVDVSPNPNNGMFQVTVDHKDNFYFQLFNELGQEVITSKKHNGRNLFDISHLANGVYFYKILVSNSYQSGKIVKH